MRNIYKHVSATAFLGTYITVYSLSLDINIKLYYVKMDTLKSFTLQLFYYL